MVPFFLSFVLSIFLTPVVAYVAKRAGILNYPGGHVKKIHAKPIPLLGGVAIYLAITLSSIFFLLSSHVLTSGLITSQHYIGVLFGGLILVIGGALDDKYDLPPRLAILAPLLAALVAIFFGIEVTKFTNPLGGFFYLAAWQSHILVFLWLLVVMYTTKFLDGLDGLSSGVSSIGVLMILLLSSTVAYFQPDVQLFSSIVLGAFIGFLCWNFHPAKIFLGEGGSTLVGYFLGILAVISGGKVATALLVLGLPLLDFIWVILRRIFRGGIQAALRGDRKHLHHRLLDMGWSQRQVVLLYYLIAAAFGATTLFLQSKQKLIALVILVLFMFCLAVFLVKKEKGENRT